jgi:hypothetical protein
VAWGGGGCTGKEGDGVAPGVAPGAAAAAARLRTRGPAWRGAHLRALAAAVRACVAATPILARPSHSRLIGPLSYANLSSDGVPARRLGTEAN